MVIAREFFLGRDRCDFDNGGLLQNLVSDFVRVRPFDVRLPLGGIALFLITLLAVRRLITFRGFFRGVVRTRLLFLGGFALRLLAPGQKINVQRLGQLRCADIAAGYDVEDLVRLALFVAHNTALDGANLKRRRL
jgi:hypothetical protein